jgi:hypothetical protein
MTKQEKEWFEPWYPLENENNFENELRKEICQDHILFEVIARRGDCDDVLFLVEDRTFTYALVHLTWSSRKENDPKWPKTEIFQTWMEWEERMKKDIESYNV